jgi:hypothetical protein
MAGQKPNFSPAQKAMLFAQATRQNWQPLPSQSLVEDSSVSFTIPKVRLLSKIYLAISGTFKATHASVTALTAARFAPFPLVKRATVQINNGFNPFQITGKGIYEYNALEVNAVIESITTLGKTASVGGTTNTIDMLLELPLVLNDRDPVGLVLAQNQETVITVNIDFAEVKQLFTDSGLTCDTLNINVAPMIETYSIPAAVEAIPDLSVLKLVQDQSYNVPVAGVNTLKMPVGLTYRKLILNYETAAGVGMTDAEMGNISLIFNQADTPYKISAALLRKLNAKAYGRVLPAGVVVFDFTDQGLPNYGGARDYIDTERLTEFWIQVEPTVVGNVQVVSETLARLAGV